MKKPRKRRVAKSRGIALVAVLILVFILAGLGAVFLSKGTSFIFRAGQKKRKATVQNVLDTAVEYALTAVGDCEEYFEMPFNSANDPPNHPHFAHPLFQEPENLPRFSRDDIPCADAMRRADVGDIHYEMRFTLVDAATRAAFIEVEAKSKKTDERRMVEIQVALKKDKAWFSVPYAGMTFLNADELDLREANGHLMRVAGPTVDAANCVDVPVAPLSGTCTDLCRRKPVLAVQGKIYCRPDPRNNCTPACNIGPRTSFFTAGAIQATGDIQCFDPTFVNDTTVTKPKGIQNDFATDLRDDGGAAFVDLNNDGISNDDLDGDGTADVGVQKGVCGSDMGGPNHDYYTMIDRTGDCVGNGKHYPTMGLPYSTIDDGVASHIVNLRNAARYDWRIDAPVYENIATSVSPSPYPWNQTLGGSHYADPIPHLPMPPETDLPDVCAVRKYRYADKQNLIFLSHTGYTIDNVVRAEKNCDDTTDDMPFYFDDQEPEHPEVDGEEEPRREWVFCHDPNNLLKDKIVYSEASMRIMGYVGDVTFIGSPATSETVTYKETTWISEKDLIIHESNKQAMKYATTPDNPFKKLFVAGGDLVFRHPGESNRDDHGSPYKTRTFGGFCANDDVYLRGGTQDGIHVERFERPTGTPPAFNDNLWKDGTAVKMGDYQDTLTPHHMSPIFEGWVQAGNLKTPEEEEYSTYLTRFSRTINMHDGDAGNDEDVPIEVSMIEQRIHFIYNCETFTFPWIEGHAEGYDVFSNSAAVLSYQEVDKVFPTP